MLLNLIYIPYSLKSLSLVLMNLLKKDIRVIEQSVNSFLDYIEHRQEKVLQRLGCAV